MSSKGKSKGANEMWGGRFSSGPSEVMERINVSIGFDQTLYRQDIHALQGTCKDVGPAEHYSGCRCGRNL